MTEQELRAVAALVRRDGEKRRENAGHAGRMDDGGGGALIAQAEAFMAGLSRRLPSGWEKYARQVDREADPDYATYQHLRAKFGGTP